MLNFRWKILLVDYWILQKWSCDGISSLWNVSNCNRVMVREKEERIVYHSDCKHLHQNLIPAIQEFPEATWQLVSDCECCYLHIFKLICIELASHVFQTIYSHKSFYSMSYALILCHPLWNHCLKKTKLFT